MHARLGQNNASASLQKEVIHDFITELYSWFALGGKKRQCNYSLNGAELV